MHLIVWGFIKSVPPKVWIVLVLISLLLYWGHTRYEDGVADTEAKYEQQLARERLQAEAERDKLEKKYQAQAKKFIEERDKEYAKLDRVIADWQSGRLRLKARFVQQACPASGDNAGTEAGLLGEDVQFLIREATRADAIVRQLTACQGLIKDGQERTQ